MREKSTSFYIQAPLYIAPWQCSVLFMHSLYVCLDNPFFILFFLFGLNFSCSSGRRSKNSPITSEATAQYSASYHGSCHIQCVQWVCMKYTILLTLQWTVPVTFIIYGCQKLNRTLLSSLFSNRVPFSLPLCIFSTILSKLSFTLSSVSTSLSWIFVCKYTFEKCHCANLIPRLPSSGMWML